MMTSDVCANCKIGYRRNEDQRGKDWTQTRTHPQEYDPRQGEHGSREVADHDHIQHLVRDRIYLQENLWTAHTMATAPPSVLLETCPDCKCELIAGSSSTHPYLGASASCWALYNVILAREYSSPALMKSVHRLTVDTYAAQHPGRPERRTTQSVWVHLVGLHLVLERGLGNDFATQTIGALTRRAGTLVWLEPPDSLGSITVQNVVDAHETMEHEQAIRRWSQSVWEAWKAHHKSIQTISSQMLNSENHA